MMNGCQSFFNNTQRKISYRCYCRRWMCDLSHSWFVDSGDDEVLYKRMIECVFIGDPRLPVKVGNG